ncbi:sporulation histidine kinase inhibitor Sda [Sporolactobacillus shoreae]|uniref:Sporulation histidine kinase inhibitor Sda n=1 Tax=Sporolactobacillus shoreae TaxID=1465501 RepID=A0A4Z0GQM8_9BACL|nr:sporulation histidine kinase inhibitor Sda [Sporolactobacillus shoreae]TGA99553.1 sporulation histidine kinase inhibitor Sda [Sporolactobacillus shoreae]
MKNLTDELLIESYKKAKKYQLSEEFIILIEEEMNRRQLHVPVHQMTK